MDYTAIYEHSLLIALPLMLFFGFSFLFARTPEKAIFENYRRSRRIMGTALLLLAANYSVHYFSGIRFANANAAILLNLSTYFLCYWLFSSALTTLLDRFYITRRRMLTHIGLWALFSVLSGIILLLLPQGGELQDIGLAVMAAWLVGYGIFLVRRLLRAYYNAVRIFNDTHSDDIGSYIRWMSVFTWWAVIFGVGCGLLTFLPDKWVFVWILSSVPFYIYLFHSYQNYLLFHEQVEKVMESEISPEEKITDGTVRTEPQRLEAPAYHAGMAEKIKEWISTDGYVRPGLTIKELSDMLHTNRTYLSEYIRTTYGVSFREWITGFRIGYAKRLLTRNPELTVADISEKSGFQSPSHFIRLFKENAGCTPTQWRKREAGQDISRQPENSPDNKKIA